MHIEIEDWQNSLIWSLHVYNSMLFFFFLTLFVFPILLPPLFFPKSSLKKLMCIILLWDLIALLWTGPVIAVMMSAAEALSQGPFRGC